jgi:hypothetical protein
MHTGNKAAKVSDHSVEGLAQGFASRQEDIVMSGHKVTRTSCRSRAKPALDPIAFGRIADLLGHREADARLTFEAGNGLHAKRRTPGAIAPGGSQKLRAPPEAAQCCLGQGGFGRHPAKNPLGRKLLAAIAAAAIENRAAVLGGHTGTETVTTGTHELGWLVCTLHDIRPRSCTVPLVWCCLKAEIVMTADRQAAFRVGGVYREKSLPSQRASTPRTRLFALLSSQAFPRIRAALVLASWRIWLRYHDPSSALSAQGRWA